MGKQTKLLCCPFCGGEAEVVFEFDEYGGCRIECTQCGASVDTVAAWNTRHVETCTIGDYKDPDYGYTHDAMWNDEWFVPSGRCSGCGEYIPVWNYCPSCGRKVDG